jgi:hypothetical protein
MEIALLGGIYEFLTIDLHTYPSNLILICLI